MTALAEAFERKGISQRSVEFKIAIARFQNNGGTLDEALALVRVAYEMSGEAKLVLPIGQCANASTRQQDTEADQPRSAQKAMIGLSASVPNDVADHVRFADKAFDGVSASSPVATGRAIVRMPSGRTRIARLVREPSVADLAAMRVAQKTATRAMLTVLDSWKVRDGRAIGDVQFSELEGLRFANAQEAVLVDLIRKHASYVEPGARVRDVIKAEELQRMIQKSAEMADAA